MYDKPDGLYGSLYLVVRDDEVEAWKTSYHKQKYNCYQDLVQHTFGRYLFSPKYTSKLQSDHFYFKNNANISNFGKFSKPGS